MTNTPQMFTLAMTAAEAEALLELTSIGAATLIHEEIFLAVAQAMAVARALTEPDAAREGHTGIAKNLMALQLAVTASKKVA